MLYTYFALMIISVTEGRAMESARFDTWHECHQAKEKIRPRIEAGLKRAKKEGKVPQDAQLAFRCVERAEAVEIVE